MGLKKGHSFRLGLHIMVSQAEIYAIKAWIMQNKEKGYRGRNIHILSDSRVAIKVLNNFLTNTLCEEIWGTAQSTHNPAKNNDRVANRTLSLKRTFI
jgi:hypothetical protein